MSALGSEMPDSSLIMGPFTMGNILGSTLYGVLCVQMFLYHTSFPADRKMIKIYVWTVFFFETAFFVFSSIAAYETLGSGWGDPRNLIGLNWAQSPLGPLSGLITSMVHGFYCWRIVRLTRNYIVTVIIALISATQFSMTLVLMAYLGRFGLNLIAVEGAFKYITIWLAGAAVADIIITVAMVHILVQARQAITFGPVVRRLHNVIKLVVQTGFLTSFAALLELSLFLGYRSTSVYYIVFYMLAKLYSNSLMATLNSRLINNINQFNCTEVVDIQLDINSAFWWDQDPPESDIRNDHDRSVKMSFAPCKKGSGIQSRKPDSAGPIHISTVDTDIEINDSVTEMETLSRKSTHEL